MSDSDQEPVRCVEKGQYLVIKDTNVVVDRVKPRILGIIVEYQEKDLHNGRWELVVPHTPTAEMQTAAFECNYLLPHEESDSESESESDYDSEDSASTAFDIHKVIEELEAAQNEISDIQRKLYDLADIRTRLEKVQEILEKSLA